MTTGEIPMVTDFEKIEPSLFREDGRRLGTGPGPG